MFDLNSLPSVFAIPVTVGLLVVSSVYFFQSRESKGKLAPGPKGPPFLGPRLSSKPWKDFEQWGKQYGKRFVVGSIGADTRTNKTSHNR